ncbi:sugar-transfer associated ATP-grasp domain-containing protein [Wenzhouxiangella sp. EGI_FJ10305]|uniref:sugar-transfer associated ATP-grasp domain-containing protein n=1 Tax=Wenzhouxiangella sp. EGI_FJ10305 TaxID=3243768 RepID=UPI0035DD3062
MKTLRRIVYLAYYLRHMNWPILKRFMGHVRERDGIGHTQQILAFVMDSLRYNISPLEWYQFGFVSLTPKEKTAWAGTGTMYEFQLRANPPESRGILDDKRRFHQAYRPFFRHPVWSLEELASDTSLIQRILKEYDQLVFKDATGNCGKNVRILETARLDADSLTDWMKSEGFDLVEGFVEQHPDLQALSPSGVNTVRIFTLIDRQGEYHLLGCRLRISVDSPVDNLAAGNLAAPIDDISGIVTGPGLYSDITRKPEVVHPVTGTPINGFRVPHWQETLDLVEKASRKYPENRSVGWDVVITPDGPGLIEGNHDWCKLLWQLPVQTGLKHLLRLSPTSRHKIKSY